jgi:hypothetical protein
VKSRILLLSSLASAEEHRLLHSLSLSRAIPKKSLWNDLS